MTDFDRIAASVPVNKQAARVAGRGVHYQSKFQPPKWQISVENPLPFTLNINPLSGISVGMRVGRMVVKGYGGKVGQEAAYVVRCDCGKWEHRKARALKTPQKPLMCFNCHNLEWIKSAEYRAKVSP